MSGFTVEEREQEITKAAFKPESCIFCENSRYGIDGALECRKWCCDVDPDETCIKFVANQI